MEIGNLFLYSIHLYPINLLAIHFLTKFSMHSKDTDSNKIKFKQPSTYSQLFWAWQVAYEQLVCVWCHIYNVTKYNLQLLSVWVIMHYAINMMHHMQKKPSDIYMWTMELPIVCWLGKNVLFYRIAGSIALRSYCAVWS